MLSSIRSAVARSWNRSTSNSERHPIWIGFVAFSPGLSRRDFTRRSLLELLLRIGCHGSKRKKGAEDTLIH